MFLCGSLSSAGQSSSSTWVLNSSPGNPSNVGNVVGSALSKGSGVGSLSFNNDGVRSSGWESGSRDLTDYYEYAVTPVTGKDFTVSTISFYCGSNSGTDPTAAAYYSLDNFSNSNQLGSNFTVTGSPGSQVQQNYTGLSIVVNSGFTLRVRVYAWGADSGKNFHNEIVVISGAAANSCTPPSQASGLSITGSPTADGFTNAGWTNGSGSSGTLIALRETAQTIAPPYSGTNYTPNLSWTSAGQINTNNRVVYKNSGTTIGGTVTGLSPNTQYTITGYAYNSGDNCYNTTSPPSASFYTLANVPGTPTVNTPTTTTLNVTIAANGNPSTTQYAIQEAGGLYVQANGSLGASAVWQTAATWGIETVTGLTHSTTYTFSVKARNANNTETAFSSAASGTTASALSAGDIAIIAFGTKTVDKFAIILLRDIAAGTIINFTDNGFASTTTGRTGEGFLTYTAQAYLCAGTIITWQNGQSIAGTGWNSNAPANFLFADSAGEQLFAFQGPTANWASQSGITLIYGLQAGIAAWRTSSTATANDSYDPSGLAGAYKVFFNNTGHTDVYLTSTTISGTSASILTMLAVLNNYTRQATAFTMPSYSAGITVANISVASATEPCAGNTSVVTLNSTSLQSGTFTVTYNLSGTNSATGSTASMTFTAGSPGSGTFTTSALSNSGSTTVTITALTLNSTGCPLAVTTGNTAAIGVKALPSVPSAFTTSSATVCQGQSSVAYTVPNDAAVTYNWSYSGTGHTINGSTNSITVDFSNSATSGTLSVTATAANGCGTSSARSIGVTVNPLPAMPSAFTASTASLCQGTNGVVYTVPNDAAVTYNWSYGGTGHTINGTGNSVTVDFSNSATSGTLSVTATATNGCGTSAARSIGVTVNPLPSVPSAFTTSSATVCQGQNSVAYTVPNDAAVTYNWSYSGTGHTISGSGNSVTYDFSNSSTSGNVSVTATATNGCGTSAARSVAVTVNPLAAVPSAFTASQAAVCKGTSGVAYTVPNDAAVTYNWSYSGTGHTINGSGNSITVDFSNSATSGTLSVTGTATNGCGTSAARTLAVTLNARPTGSISTTSVICNGANATLNLSVTGSGTISGLINPGSIAFSGTAPTINVSVAPTANTTYTIASLSDANCSAFSSGLTGSAEVTVKERPKALITGNQSICAGQNAVLTITTLTSGAYTGTLNPGGIAFSGNGPVFTKTVTPGSTTTYTIASLTKGSCSAIPALDLVGAAVVTVNPGTSWYPDQDEDGYGDMYNGVTACVQPSGYIVDGTDCDDDNADMNPGADEWFNGLDDNCDGQIDEEVAGITFYQDDDGDGYGDPENNVLVAFTLVAGYVTNDYDCDDSSASRYPGATELCNGIDDDCDGDIDEGCGPANDYIEGAMLLYPSVYTYGNPSSVTGTLAGAHTDPQAGASCTTGEDVWYYFTSSTKAVRVRCTTTANNLLIELRTAGSLIDTENIQNIVGDEILNYAGLTPGETYFIRVRNYNSAQGAGTFNLSVQNVLSSYCTIQGPYNLCTQFKAKYISGASGYKYEFSPVGSPSTEYTAVSSSDLIPLYSVFASVTGSPYNTTYNAEVTLLWTLTTGNGSTEVLQVPMMATVPYQFTLGDNPPAELKSTDRCSASAKSLYSWVSCTYMCGATDYKWSFEELIGGVTPSGQVINKFRGNSNSLIQLSSISQLQWGKTYRVRIAPVYGGIGNAGTLGVYGGYQTLCIMNLSLANGAPADESYAFGNTPDNQLDTRSETSQTTHAAIYPNPNRGDQLAVNYVPNDHSNQVDIRLFDALGKQVFNKHYAFDGSLNTIIDLNQITGNGIYLLEFVSASETITHRLVIEQ